jgi:hypothetical protein
MAKLTDNQRRWLCDLRDGRDPMDRYNGRSARGGATTVKWSLLRAGYTDKNGQIAAEGEKVICAKIAEGKAVVGHE